MIKLLNGKRRNILHTVNNEILILKVNQHIQMKIYKGIGEYCFPCIEKQKERKKNKISIYDNFDDD